MYDYSPIINCTRCGKRLPNLVDPHLCNGIMRGGRGSYWNDEITKLRSDNATLLELLEEVVKDSQMGWAGVGQAKSKHAINTEFIETSRQEHVALMSHVQKKLEDLK